MLACSAGSIGSYKHFSPTSRTLSQNTSLLTAQVSDVRARLLKHSRLNESTLRSITSPTDPLLTPPVGQSSRLINQSYTVNLGSTSLATLIEIFWLFHLFPTIRRSRVYTAPTLRTYTVSFYVTPLPLSTAEVELNSTPLCRTPWPQPISTPSSTRTPTLSSGQLVPTASARGDACR
jgi:hypothetical protein